MPLEIRELIIKAEIKEGKYEERSSDIPADINAEKLISTCVDRVMEILKDQKER